MWRSTSPRAAAELTDVAQRWLRNPDGTQDLQSGTVEVVPWTYLHEPITGTVLPAGMRARPGNDVQRMPRALLTSAQNARRDTLLRAVQADLDRRDDPTLTSRVIDISFGIR